MSDSIEDLEEQLVHLRRAIASGILSVQIKGQLTMYQSTANMQRAANDLERRINELRGTPVSRPRFSNINLSRGV